MSSSGQRSGLGRPRVSDGGKVWEADVSLGLCFVLHESTVKAKFNTPCELLGRGYQERKPGCCTKVGGLLTPLGCRKLPGVKFVLSVAILASLVEVICYSSSPNYGRSRTSGAAVWTSLIRRSPFQRWTRAYNPGRVFNYLSRRLASEGIVALGVTLCVCVCPPSRLCRVSTARRISLGGEGNALYPLVFGTG